jgi:hypothetical protein
MAAGLWGTVAMLAVGASAVIVSTVKGALDRFSR